MRAPALAAIGIAAYLVFLVAMLPASVVLASAQKAEPGKFDVTQASGTIWRGAARLAVNTPGGPVPIDRFEWRWLPARLFTGRLALDITASTTGLEAHYVGARAPG